MQQRISLITLGVDDIETMSRFYTEVFGWMPLRQSTDQIKFFRLNGVKLALFDRDALAEDADIPAEGSGFRSFSLAYNLGSKEQVDVCFEELISRGARIVKQPEMVYWGGYRGYIADPEGNLWELAWNPYLNDD